MKEARVAILMSKLFSDQRILLEIGLFQND